MPSEVETDRNVRALPRLGLLESRWGSVCLSVVLGVILIRFADARPHVSFAFPFLIVVASIIAAALHEGGHAIGAAIAFLEQQWNDAETATGEALGQCDRIADIGAATVIREGIVGLLDDIAVAKVKQRPLVP